jgi:hypothetical protein
MGVESPNIMGGDDQQVHAPEIKTIAVVIETDTSDAADRHACGM